MNFINQNSAKALEITYKYAIVACYNVLNLLQK